MPIHIQAVCCSDFGYLDDLILSVFIKKDKDYSEENSFSLKKINGKKTKQLEHPLGSEMSVHTTLENCQIVANLKTLWKMIVP